MWEPTLYALQMSSCLIINPTFHAYVNFIITDTCLHLGLHTCMHVHAHAHTTTCPPPFQTATVEEQLRQRQLPLISLYLRYLFLAFSLSPLSLHTFFFLLLIPLCFSLFVSYPNSFSPLSLIALPTCQVDSPPKRSDVPLFYFYLPFLESSHFFEMPPQRIHITGSSLSTNLQNLAPSIHTHTPSPPPPPPPCPSDSNSS